LNPENDEYGTGHADCEPEYVYKRDSLVLENISESHFEVVDEHSRASFYI